MIPAAAPPIPLPTHVSRVRRPIVLSVAVSISVTSIFSLGAAGNMSSVLFSGRDLLGVVIVPSLGEPFVETSRVTWGKILETGHENIKREGAGRGAAAAGGWPTVW